ncbi:MAG: hypothetical protein NC408_00260 [Candidatus Gastranaerophilales bacterium]|nr:hypothetical protein [Candidatus Gastranaerophilales bacterium]MCM1073068.1 hypothetical protein [Bacteroides sp.]
MFKDKKLLYKNKTNFFRNDLNWENLVKFLDEKYKNTDKVNIINTACSDGTEPFSLAVILMEKLKSKAAKFFPIYASDIDETMINDAKNSPCNISDIDFYMINKHTRSESYKYFSPAKSTNFSYPMAVLPTEKLKSQIKFKQADIFEALNDLPPKNNVILCRNFWVYLAEQTREKLIEVLKNKLTPSDSVIIGELENGWGIDNMLKKAGFEETVVRNIYEKPKV